MASFDLSSVISVVPAIVPQTAGVANINSLAIDTAGYESFCLAVTTGSGNTNGTITAAVTGYESDDNTRANATAIPANRVTYNPVINNSNATFQFNWVPVKQYVFAEVDPAATFGSPISAVAILGDPANAPTGTSQA